MIFSRRRAKPGRHARDDSRRSGQAPARRSPADEVGVVDVGGDAADEAASPPAGDAPVAAATGPYDVSVAPSGVTRLDLGSLQIPAVPGVEVRVQANPEGQVQQVALVHGGSALQMRVFAAPRTEGIWDEVRTDIRKSLFAEGVGVEEVDGPYGVELRARARTQQGLNDLRFVGVDGPRWMVQVVYQGPAAADVSYAGPLVECLHGLVVDRGSEAKPTREPLPLRLSGEMAARLRDQAATPPEGAAAPAPAAPAAAAPGGAGGAAAGTRADADVAADPGGTAREPGPGDITAAGPGAARAAPTTSAGTSAPAGTGPRRRSSPRPRRASQAR